MTEKMKIAYHRQYPKDKIGEGYGPDVIIHGDKEYSEPADETEEKFFDRLARSKKAGKNLFLTEWSTECTLPPDAEY